jgi:hypothetical protein
MKVYSGKQECVLSTPLEFGLAAALKAVVLSKGGKGMIKNVHSEIRLSRFSFSRCYKTPQR